MGKSTNSTILDVAKLSGFSKATVSRAFTYPDIVSPKTKEKIYSAAKVLSYTPNPVARAMVKKKTDNVAFVICGSELNALHAQMLEAILKETSKKKYSLFVCLIPIGKELSPDEFLIKRQIDGVVIAGNIDVQMILSFKRQNIPIVILNSVLDLDEIVCVASDERMGAYQAMEYLISNRYKRIGFITGGLSSYVYNCRYNNYTDILRKNNIDIDYRFIQMINPTLNDSYVCVKNILKLSNRPDALFCADDIIAAGAIKASIHSGLRVPEDIAILGYGNSDICTLSEPGISTIHVEGSQMGEVSAKTLIELIEGGVPKSNIILTKTRLIKRGSV